MQASLLLTSMLTLTLIGCGVPETDAVLPNGETIEQQNVVLAKGVAGDPQIAETRDIKQAGDGLLPFGLYKCTIPELKPRKCATVTAINPGSKLQQHKQPNYTGGVYTYTHYTNGHVLAVLCWTTGAGDIDGHGDHYWFKVDDGIIGGGYVNDWYLTTGSYSQWSPQLDHC